MTLYRSESAYGSGVRDIVDIIEYEIFDLYNTDIADYLLSKHKAMFSDDTMRLLELINAEDLDDIKNPRTAAEQIVTDINRYTKRNYRYALWLAEESVVKNLYADDSGPLDAYETSGLIINDLGHDGALYAYEELPVPKQIS